MKPTLTPQALAAGLHRKPNGFRALRPGESWHTSAFFDPSATTDFIADLLSEGFRPLLLGEISWPDTDEYYNGYGAADGRWLAVPIRARMSSGYLIHRTTRPLPE